MVRLTLIAFTLLLASCGPFVMPMFHRLDDEQQAAADQVWHNMLTPANRLDRQTLLDTVCVNYLYGTGIDRASYHAEKRVDHQLVTLDITFDRERPLQDEFSIAVIGGDGRVLRKETWSRARSRSCPWPKPLLIQADFPNIHPARYPGSPARKRSRCPRRQNGSRHPAQHPPTPPIPRRPHQGNQIHPPTMTPRNKSTLLFFFVAFIPSCRAQVGHSSS